MLSVAPAPFTSVLNAYSSQFPACLEAQESPPIQIFELVVEVRNAVADDFENEWQDVEVANVVADCWADSQDELLSNDDEVGFVDESYSFEHLCFDDTSDSLELVGGEFGALAPQDGVNSGGSPGSGNEIGVTFSGGGLGTGTHSWLVKEGSELAFVLSGDISGAVIQATVIHGTTSNADFMNTVDQIDGDHPDDEDHPGNTLSIRVKDDALFSETDETFTVNLSEENH